MATTNMELVRLVSDYSNHSRLREELSNRVLNLNFGDGDQYHYPGYTQDLMLFYNNYTQVENTYDPYNDLARVAGRSSSFNDFWGTVEQDMHRANSSQNRSDRGPFNLTPIKKSTQGSTTSYSGADMLADVVFPGSPAIRMGVISTISYSVYRDKKQVRTLGRISAKGITKGPRTVAGTMIFSVIEEHFVNDLVARVSSLRKYAKIKPDELPPFDLVITFGNEYGQAAKMVIYGVTFIDDSMTLSIEDLFTENTLTYYARDIDVMNQWSTDMKMYTQTGTVLRADTSPVAKFSIDNILRESDIERYQEFRKKFGIS